MEDEIIKKLENGEELTIDEKLYIIKVLDDPLQEFCHREARFRLKDIHGVKEEFVEDYADDVEDAIRYIIDNDSDLYDSIDNKIGDIVNGSDED